MERYDIFESECGYRVCLGVYLNSPVMESSSWFETKEEAEAASKKTKFDDETRNMRKFKEDGEWMVVLDEEFFACRTEEEAKNKILKKIESLGYSRAFILNLRRDLR